MPRWAFWKNKNWHPDFWKKVKEVGVQFVIVQAWGGWTKNEYDEQLETTPGAEAFLTGASLAGLPVAAYCLLSFDQALDEEGQTDENGNPKPWTGAWQVRQAFEAVGNAVSALSFMAIDVEREGGLGGDTGKRVQRIWNAVNEARRLYPQIPVVIYTSYGGWEAVTGLTTEFQNYPLWESHYDGVPYLHLDKNDKNGKIVPFISFGGWQKRVGKQYERNKPLLDKDGTTLFSETDPNVFEAAMFRYYCVYIPPRDQL